jgi:SIR2-like protein
MSAARGVSARPRSKLRVGDATVNASDLRGLRYAWRTRQLSLFLGAGVSIPYGLPSWNNLVLELLFEQAQTTRRLGGMWPHYRRAVASWMTDYFDYDPLVLARMVERDLRFKKRAGAASRAGGRPELFLERLRTHMYANYRVPRGRTTLQAISELVAKGTKRSGVDAVVTFNFDDLLERELRQRRVPVCPVTSSDRQHGAGLRVIHAHGYVPRSGPLSRKDIIFTEPDYHRLTESMFHWSLSEVVERLRKSTVLFIGLSMSDPNLRRLLDASRNSEIPPHWQIQKRHEIRDHEVLEAMADVDRRARDYATLLGSGLDRRSKPAQLEESVHAALRQADTYDREVFQSMGVKTIWVDRFDQIVDIIDAIAL